MKKNGSNAYITYKKPMNQTLILYIYIYIYIYNINTYNISVWFIVGPITLISQLKVREKYRDAKIRNLKNKVDKIQRFKTGDHRDIDLE